MFNDLSVFCCKVKVAIQRYTINLIAAGIIVVFLIGFIGQGV